MIWDAVSDLLLGHWSDKTSSVLGRRHPFMYASFFVLPLTFYALFNPVIELNEDNTFFYVLALALLIRTGTTLFEVPSTALLPDLETDYDRRNKWLRVTSFLWLDGRQWHTHDQLHVLGGCLWCRISDRLQYLWHRGRACNCSCDFDLIARDPEGCGSTTQAQ